MRIYDGTTYRDMTAEEITARENEAKKAAAIEKHRPLTEAEVSRLLITAQVNTLAVDDATALRMLEYYPLWEAGTAYSVGFKVRYNGKLWRVVQAHTSQAGWEPENMASLWETVNETHAGTLEDPIPYDGNMALEAGKYYIQASGLYLCSRGTGSPVYHPLAALLGLYVEAV